MSLVDLLILAVLMVSTVSALVKGFFVEVFSLAGVILGLFLAAANYAAFATLLQRVIANHESANLVAFVVIALLVMVVAGLLGRLLRSVFRGIGLGIVDRLLGAVFGLIKGGVIVTLVLLAIVAFLPRQAWLNDSRLAPVFLTAVHGGSQVVPFVLGEKIRHGLDALRVTQSNWLNRGSRVSP